MGITITVNFWYKVTMVFVLDGSGGEVGVMNYLGVGQGGWLSLGDCRVFEGE